MRRCSGCFLESRCKTYTVNLAMIEIACSIRGLDEIDLQVAGENAQVLSDLLGFPPCWFYQDGYFLPPDFVECDQEIDT